MSKNTRTIGYGGNDVVKPADEPDVIVRKGDGGRITWGDTPLNAEATGLQEATDEDAAEIARMEDAIGAVSEELANGDVRTHVGNSEITYHKDRGQKPKDVIKDSLERTHSARDVLSYYPIEVKHPLDPDREPYTVDAIDIIEALGMSYSEGSLFKALWRKCAVRQGVYRREQSDAQKMLFFSHRVLGDDVTPKGKKA